MDYAVAYKKVEPKTKYIQIRTTESFYNTVRSFAKEHNISMTEALEIGFSLLLEEDAKNE